MKVRASLPIASFKCAFLDCTRSFRNVTQLECHVYREHQDKRRAQVTAIERVSCHVEFCDVRCNDLSSLNSHLKSHIREGRAVSCPFRQCGRTFSVVSSFTSHFSRVHKSCTASSLLGLETVGRETRLTATNEQVEDVSVLEGDLTDDITDDNEGDQAAVLPERADESLFLHNLAFFYLKLQAKLLLPASVIQSIIEDFQAVHDISQSHLLHKLDEKLVSLDISDSERENVIEVLKSEDLFRACNTGTLKTDQRQKTVFTLH